MEKSPSEFLMYLAEHMEQGYNLLSEDERFQGSDTDWSFVRMNVNKDGDIDGFKVCALSCAEFSIKEMVVDNHFIHRLCGVVHGSHSITVPINVVTKCIAEEVDESFLKQIDDIMAFENHNNVRLRMVVFFLNDDLKIDTLHTARILRNIAEKLV